MNNLLFFINKHKNIVYLSLLVLVLLLGLMFHKPIIEGLTSDMIGEYDYLKPSSEIVSDDTWTRLATFTHTKCGPEPICPAATMKNYYDKSLTTDEINYYIQNGSWPWGSYITNAVTNQITTYYKSLNVTDTQKIQSLLVDQKKLLSTRAVYERWGLATEEKAMTPQPLSYKIYMGFTPPPTAETGTTTTGTNNYYNKLVSAVGTTGTTTGTNKYYNEFVSLCKKVNPVSS